MKKSAVAAAIASYVLWGLLPIYWKLLKHIPAIFILCNRIVFSCIFMLLVLAASKKLHLMREVFTSRKKLLCTVGSAVLITINWFVYIWAVNANHVLDSSLGYYINPLMVFAFSVLLFREKSGIWEYVAVGLATAGVLYMTLRVGRFPFVALTLALSFTLYGVFKKMADLDAAVSLTLETLFVTPFALGYLLFTGFGPTGVLSSATVGEIVLLICAGVVTAVPLLLYSIGVKGLPLSLIGFFQYFSPTLMLLLGVLLYGEPFDVNNLISFACIWLGLILFTASKMRQSRQAHVAAREAALSD